MQNKQRLFIGSLLIIALLLLSTWAIQAGSGGSYEIDWFTMDGGGTISVVTGSYKLNGTIGQPDTASSAGGPYSLDAGFWVMGSATKTFLPIITRP